MDKTTTYQNALRSLSDWDPYLRAESGLPGPRGNLELAYAAAELASQTGEHIEGWLACGPEVAPENTPEVFLAVCGTIALGYRLVQGHREALPRLRALANDLRWRVREGVAMALQCYGDADMDGLLESTRAWSGGSWLEQRAVMAALCEPRLLREPRYARAALDVLDEITGSLQTAQDRRSDAFQALRKGLAYGWSVAVAALPEEGKPRFERWLPTPDKDVRWVLNENLKKNRLLKMDAAWVEQVKSSLSSLSRAG